MVTHKRPGRWLGLLAVCALALAARGADAQKIQTIIGPANEDGLLATQVQMHAPADVIIEPSGSVLVLEVGALRLSTDLLTSVPSIIIGLFAYAVLVRPFHRFSALAGGMTTAEAFKKFGIL